MKPLALRIGAAAVCLALGAHADTLAVARKLSIDRLYSLPWVTGSQPKDPAWSPDSRRLAFLWNDTGSNFYDVWLTDVRSGKPVRVTSMPELPRGENSAKDFEQLTQVDLVVLPGSPHGWDTEGLAQTRFAYHKLVEFFRLHLGEGPSP